MTLQHCDVEQPSKHLAGLSISKVLWLTQNKIGDYAGLAIAYDAFAEP